MTSIATLTGRVIDFLNPDPDQLNLDDIAAGLSAQPRYTGQTIRPYNVLQHSLLVAELAAPENRLHALLHDAPEAYLCDVPSPAKEAMRQVFRSPFGGDQLSAYDALEARLWRAICRRWDLSPDMPDDVKTADLEAMLIEAPRLQPEGWKHPFWDGHRDRAVPAWASGYLYQLLGMGPSDCRAKWILDVATEITKRRAAA